MILQTGGAPGKICRPRERGSHDCTGLLLGPMALQVTHVGASCSRRTETHIGAVCGEPKPVGRTHGTVGEECEEWPETMCDLVIPVPISHLTEQLYRGGRVLGIKCGLGRERSGGKVF